MEHVRRIRPLVPLAVFLVVGSVALTRPAAMHAGDPPWEPPPCPPGDTASRPGASAWYSLDVDLDANGSLTGWRLSLGGLDGRAVRHLALPPESFASGPAAGRVLVGDDDGSRSRLRMVDVAGGCATPVGVETSVVRSAVLSLDGGAVWEHRVNRATRVDEGVWRRPLDGRPAARVMPGLAPDERHGPTFSTQLLPAADGRLAVASCGELRCRVRVLDPRTGRLDRLEGTGPLIGIARDRAITYAPCHGLPCRIEAIDLRSGQRTTLLDAGGPAALGGADGLALVHEASGGALATLEIGSLRDAVVAGPESGWPVRGGSAATSGADLPDGWVLLAPSGHLANPATARRLDVATGAVGQLLEVEP